MKEGYFFEENPKVDMEKIDADRRVLRNMVISSARSLYEQGITDFRANENNPEVKDFFEKYRKYGLLAKEIADPEQKLLALLDEHMLPFDAGLITEKEKLEELDTEIVNEYSKEAEEGNFSDLRNKVNDYRAEIASKLKR